MKTTTKKHRLPNKKLIDLCNDRRFNIVRERIKICSFILVIYIIFSFLHIGCPIKFVSGISCPGCGMSRSILAIFHLDFKSAFFYHPLFVITPIMIFLFLFEAYINTKLYKVAWFIIVILFLIIYIIRLMYLENDVVSIDIDNGIVLKLIHKILVGGFK